MPFVHWMKTDEIITHGMEFEYKLQDAKCCVPRIAYAYCVPQIAYAYCVQRIA
jgi:hypothetical protein